MQNAILIVSCLMVPFATQAQRAWYIGIESGPVFEDNRVTDFGGFLNNRTFYTSFTLGIIIEKEISDRIDIESGILYREPELNYEPRNFTKGILPLRIGTSAPVMTIPLKVSYSYTLVVDKVKLFSNSGIKLNFSDQAEDLIIEPRTPWSDIEAGIEYVDCSARTRIRRNWLTGIIGLGNKIQVSKSFSAYWLADYTFGWRDIATSDVTYKLVGETERTAKVDSRDNHWSIVGGIRLNLTSLKKGSSTISLL